MGLNVKQLNAKFNSMVDEREYWVSDYIGLSRVFKARKVRFLEKDYSSKQENLRLDILDGTGVRSARTLAAGMHGGMTSPARPWFELGFEDVALNQSQAVGVWIDEVQRRMRGLLARSNFYQAIHALYLELGIFGTGFMFEHADSVTGIRFNTVTVGRYVLGVDSRGRVNTIGRDMEMTAENIKDMFGEGKCTSLVKAAAGKPETAQKKFPVRHIVCPNIKRNYNRADNTNMRWSSYYYEPGADPRNKGTGILRESGYDNFPGFGPRWTTDSEEDVYGYSPGMDSLGDSRMLQSIRDTYLRMEHKNADPPMVVPEGIEGTYDSLPGGVTPVNTSMNGQQVIYPAEGGRPNTQGILVITQDVRIAIREGMYNDLFKMFADAPLSKDYTATEVVERHGEKLIQLGPVLERLHDELFNPLIDRTFQIMVDTDQIPEPPLEIRNTPIKVTFISILAQAQKLMDTTKVDQFMGFIGAYSELLPELKDIPNADLVGDGYADALSIPTGMINSHEERQARRIQRAEDAAKQQNAEMGAAATDIAKGLSETPVAQGETTALDMIMEGVK